MGMRKPNVPGKTDENGHRISCPDGHPLLMPFHSGGMFPHTFGMSNKAVCTNGDWFKETPIWDKTPRLEKLLQPAYRRGGEVTYGLTARWHPDQVGVPGAEFEEAERARVTCAGGHDHRHLEAKIHSVPDMVAVAIGIKDDGWQVSNTFIRCRECQTEMVAIAGKLIEMGAPATIDWTDANGVSNVGAFWPF